MRKYLYVLFALLFIFAAVGCGGGGAADKTSAATEPVADNTTAAPEPSGQQEAADAGKALVVYFSRVGNSEFPADIDVVATASLAKVDGVLKGNAQLAAEWIADEAGCELFPIKTATSYPADYQETRDVISEEYEKKITPELTSHIENFDDYSAFYFVAPVYVGDLPMAVYGFFDEYDFSGKQICVFITQNGKKSSAFVDIIRELEPQAEIVEALTISSADALDSEQAVRQWVKDANK